MVGVSACIRPSDSCQLLEAPRDLVQPLHVVTKEGKKPRLVLDLSRNLNDLIEKETFKTMMFQDAVDASSPGCFYGKTDLSDCFLSFPVHERSRRLLAFQLIPQPNALIHYVHSSGLRRTGASAIAPTAFSLC